MNEIVFKDIEIRNFLSIGNQPLKVYFNRGLNFVVGWNHQTQSSNGVGKTAIFYNAILYALFGESSRNVRQNSLINYTNKGKMYVALSIHKGTDDILIYRSRKPNNFYYILNSVEFKNNDIRETQNQLNKLLDISEDVFTNTFIINASDMIDFIKDEGSVRLKERFEKIFFKDVVFRKILEYVRRELNELDKKLLRNKSSIEEKFDFAKKVKSYIDGIKQKKDYEIEIKKCKKEIEKWQHELHIINPENKIKDKNSKLDILLDNKGRLSKKIDAKQKKLYQLEAKIKSVDTKLDMISSKNRECPLCKQVIFGKAKRELNKMYMEEKDKSSKEIKGLKGEKRELDTKMSKIKLFEKKLSAQIWELQQVETTQRSQINERIEYIKKDIIHFQESYGNQMKMKHEFDDLKNELRGLKKESSNLNMDKSDLEIMTTLFDNTGGILSFFIEKVLSALNLIIDKFVEKMTLDFSFYFDNDLKLKFDVYDQLNLGNFSGGEQKAINFIVLFSLMEFFFNTVGFKPSFIVIDEIMDTSLASDKIDIILKILKEFHELNDMGIYLLSHDYKGITNGVIEFDSVYELAKKDGFTMIEKITKK